MRGSMKDIKAKLESLSFSEANAGCLINLNYVKRVGKDSVILTSGQELPISRRLKKQFAQDYINFGRRKKNVTIFN